MIIFGVNSGHTHFGKRLRDGSASCITVNADGTIQEIRSIAEERVTRIKSAGGFDFSLEELTSEMALSLSDIDITVISSCCENAEEVVIGNQLKSCKQVIRVPSHHLAHALSAFCLSPFDEAIVVVWDCGGNTIDSSTHKWWAAIREQHTYYIANRTGLRVVDRDFMEPYEMGFGEIYRSLTHFLGFTSHIDSAKAMALAAYGDPTILKKELLFRMGSGKIKSSIRYKPGSGESHIERWLKKVNIGVDPVPKGSNPATLHASIAAYVQSEMIHCALAKIESLCRYSGIHNICIAGGVALNCVMNAAINNSGFINGIFIPPAAGDTGQSIGNCFYGYLNQFGRLPKLQKFSPFIGSSLEIKRNCNIVGERFYNGVYTLNDLSLDAITQLVAVAIFANLIIGWCQGKSEWGPRALGNRSILCRADKEDIGKRLRSAIKGRLYFEPFAASVLLEDVSRYFEANEPFPYMLQTVNVRKSMSKYVQNVTHIDGTCRLQTVEKEDNQIFYDLLNKYKAISGESVIVNTSLNKRGDPICETINDALEFLISSDLDILFVGNSVMTKSGAIFRWICNSHKKLFLPIPASRNVDTQDLSLLMKCLAGTLTALPCGPSCGDLNNDGRVDVLDLVKELLAVAGIG